MPRISVDKLGTIDLGRQGENLATTIEIDVSSLLKKWPTAIISLLVKRKGDVDPYFADADVKDGVLVWPITKIETAVVGDGKIEIQAITGEVIAKSVTATIRVGPSLSGSASTEPPDIRPSWVDQVLNGVGSGGSGCTVALDTTLSVAGKAADAAAVGKRVSALSKDIEDLSEQVTDNIIENLTKFDVEGDFVQFAPKNGSKINVVTSFSEHNSAWNYLYLNHITSRNLMDFTNRFGGAGKIIEKDGMTATLNDDGTVTVKGTNTSASWNFLLNVVLDTPYSDYVFPPGTYTTPLTVELRTADNATNYGNRGGTFTIDTPFRITKAYIAYASGETADTTFPLCIVRDSVLPQSDFKYKGVVYKAQFSQNYAEGVYDWATGKLYDVDGNLLETTGIVGITAYDGDNIMWVGNGTVKATAYTTGISGTVEITGGFDPEQWGLPILRLTGDTQAMTKDDAVELSYVFGTRQGTCTVKWQGSSSLAYPKKNYTIKFDNAFEAAEGWGEQKKYCAKANWIDHSHSRNVVNAKLWGQVVKSRKTVPTELKNLVNGGAVDGFPILIIINGDLKGVYTFNIPKDGWMFGMGSGTSEAIVCADTWGQAVYYKAEATLDGSDFELEYVSDEDNADWVATSLNRLIMACIDSDGSDLDTTIAHYLDWDSAIDYLIFTVLIVGYDMTARNYLNATFDGVKWFFSAYDMDCTHCLSVYGDKYIPATHKPSFAEFAADHKVMELIVNYKKDALKARYAELRETVLSESNVATEFANFAGLIPSPVLMQEAKLWPGIPNTSTNNISQIRDAYRMRCALTDKWMESL